MGNYRGPELVVTSNMKNFHSEELRFLFVGDEAFLKRSEESPYAVSIAANHGLMATVKNWYGQHEQPLIAEVMDAGLRMRPDTVVFNYEDIFLAGHDAEAIALILNHLSQALRTGHSVWLIYDRQSSPKAAETVARAFPEFITLTDG